MFTKTYIYGCGYLNKINLKQSDGYIHGKISIRTSLTNVVTFNAYQSEFTKSGKINPSYRCFQKVMKEYKDSTTGNADYVEIKYNNKYPNADIQFKDEFVQNLKLIHRVAKCQKSKVVFKIYGIRFNGKNFDVINYNNEMKQVNISTDDNLIIGEIYDIVGHIVEGLEDGFPVHYLKSQKTRKSDLQLDFENAIIKEEIQPF